MTIFVRRFLFAFLLALGCACLDWMAWMGATNELVGVTWSRTIVTEFKASDNPFLFFEEKVPVIWADHLFDVFVFWILFFVFPYTWERRTRFVTLPPQRFCEIGTADFFFPLSVLILIT